MKPFRALASIFALVLAVASQARAGFSIADTALSAAPNPVAAGDAVTLTATVTGGSQQPTGFVNFGEGMTVLGFAYLDASGHASFTTSSLSPGTHTLTAYYGGNSTYVPSQSAPLAVVVAAPTGIPMLSTPALLVTALSLAAIAWRRRRIARSRWACPQAGWIGRGSRCPRSGSPHGCLTMRSIGSRRMRGPS